MRVLMIADYAGSFPYLDELAMHLQKKEVESWCLDVFNLEYRVFDGGNVFSKPKSLAGTSILKRFLGLSKRVAHRSWGRPFYQTAQRFLQQPTQKFLKQHAGQFDLVVLQYVNHELLPFVGSLRKAGKALISVIWGSDFYRSSNAIREKQRAIYRESDAIMFGNPKTAQDFVAYYGDYSSKVTVANFGIEKLDLLKNTTALLPKSKSKEALGLPISKLAVSCGYNGGAAQQHELIIDAISHLADAEKEQLHLVFLMSYGADKGRIEAIRGATEQADLSYTLIDRFLSDEEVVHLRWATDLVINAQTTDSLSASLQEHLFAQNVLLVGEWLPYDVFKNIGIAFSTFNRDNLQSQLEAILVNWPHFSALAASNPEKIFRLSGWQYAVDKWIAAFDKAIRNLR